ncbi:uncharacterized protein LOC107270873 [Cephus cinctus]|uniref:Uncharacterized protein LOC107270873 n=1 Tax=Cephus cinctus TaxID=211228 RepID=A0AAJ7FPF7_CEPCN|nr:uncharacterized protein LOC107270873 [Cephus cinctus]
MMLLKSFFRRIIKDFRHKELLPLKLIFFVQASTLYVLYPYLTIHMRELGINVEETAIMSAVTPFVAIVMPPLAGLLADRIGNFKILLSLFSSLGGGAALLLLLVPVGRVTVQFPERVIMDLSCPLNNEGLLYTMNQNYPCETKLAPEVNTRLESCGYICYVDLHDDSEVEAILMSRSYVVKHYDLSTGLNSSYKYTISKADLPKYVTYTDDIREHRKLTNNEFYKTSIRQLSKSTFYFPTGQLYDFSCTDFENDMSVFNNSTFVSNRELTDLHNGNDTFCTFGKSDENEKYNQTREINYYSYKSKMTALDPTDIDKFENKRRYMVDEIAWNDDNFRKPKCDKPVALGHKVALSFSLINYTVSPEPYKFFYLEGCSKRCILTAPRKDVCSNKEMEIEYDVQLTFWLYLAIRVFIGMIGGTAFAMFEGAVIAILREQKADYGLQRIYGSIGGMISSPLSGLLIDYASRGKGYTDFRPAFYLYAGLKLASGLLMLAINLEFKSPASNVVKDVVSVLKNIELAALFIACFVLGTAWGYIESFLFWLLQDLGASRSLMGITITVGGIAGIPLLVLSGPIINKIGHANVLFIGFIFYAVRLVGYSVIYNPWLCLIFEALESVTSSLSFTAAVTYAAKLSSTTTDSSIQGLLGGLYYGVGKGSGSLIGGYLMKALGTRPTYQIFAAVSLITGLMYFIFNAAYLKKRPQVEGNDIVKKKPKKPKDQVELEGGETVVGNVDKGKIYAIDNEAFKEEEKLDAGSKDIEILNNAKNLGKTDKTKSIEKSGELDSIKLRSQSNLDNSARRRNYEGVTNSNFENDVGDKCDVIIEKEPDDKK